MKKTIAAVLALVMALMLVACGSSALKDAAGTYKLQQSKFVGDEEWVTDEEFVLELKDDGTGSSTRDGATYDLTWKLEGETFTMTETFLGLTIDYTGTLKDGKIDMFNGDPESDLTYEYVLAKA
ncbi:MAG: hypothetical protein J5441_00140 [Clostridia bacterium]|nr:hypothetical protein [Clostridia bacterium]